MALDMSTEKKSIVKPKPVSGFPEWLPEIRIVEQQWFDHIRKTFESYGFCSIETPSVEELDVLAAKGVDKEIYVLDRLHADPNDKKEARLALHFDQTVPLARYVAQRFNDLVFPFKRYQMQRVWRGERPQMGRSREFYQCDIDIINVDGLPISFDAELPAIIYEALGGLGIGRFQIRISNRKILTGLLQSMGLDSIEVFREIDKLDKIGADQVRAELAKTLSPQQIDTIMNVASIKAGAEEAQALLAKLETVNEQMAEGVSELRFVMSQLEHLPEHAVVADLSIVRGLDYYTGTVYETRLLDFPEFTSSICSGGRYDDLASGYINKHLPGVGISIGFTRLFQVMQQFGVVPKDGPKSPTDVLVILPSEDQRALAHETGRSLRLRGLNVEVYHAPQKIDRQISYAEKKAIPFIWFLPNDRNPSHSVKNIFTREQVDADPDRWEI